jgi:hypothetical protein
VSLCSGSPTPPPHRRTHPEPSLSHPEAYGQRGCAGRPDRQSSSASRVTAGAVGFFTLIKFALRPERQLAVSTQCLRSRARKRA